MLFEGGPRFLAQFVFGASMGWNLVSVVDFTVELYDPLRNTRSLVKYYHVFVWLWAAATVAYVGLADVFGSVLFVACFPFPSAESTPSIPLPCVTPVLVLMVLAMLRSKAWSGRCFKCP